MTVKAVLWKFFTLKNGTSNVKIYAYQNSRYVYLKTDVHVTSEQWDEERGEVKKTHPQYKMINAAIQRKIVEISNHFYSGGDLNGLLRKKSPQSGSLLVFAQNFINEVEKGLHEIKPATNKKYKGVLSRLKKYCDHKGLDDLDFEDINLEFYYRYSEFLKDHCRCNRPGISNHIKVLKKWLNESQTRGLHTNEAHKQKAFKVFRERTSNKIYLTESEIQKIIDLDLSTQPALGRERDRFLISYFFVMRYSDSVRIQRDLFFEEEGQYYYRNIAQKTNRESIIPVKPVAWQILQKYNFSMAGDTNQEANRKLKIIMAMAGLTDEAREGEKVAQKCVFVTTHTARRSAATNLYLKGTSLKIIADLGGWENAEVLRFYLRGSGMDSAKAAKDLDFFK